MVSTHLENVIESRSSAQLGVKINNVWNHHLVFRFQYFILGGQMRITRLRSLFCDLFRNLFSSYPPDFHGFVSKQKKQTTQTILLTSFSPFSMVLFHSWTPKTRNNKRSNNPHEQRQQHPWMTFQKNTHWFIFQDPHSIASYNPYITG